MQDWKKRMKDVGPSWLTLIGLVASRMQWKYQVVILRGSTGPFRRSESARRTQSSQYYITPHDAHLKRHNVSSRFRLGTPHVWPPVPPKLAAEKSMGRDWGNRAVQPPQSSFMHICHLYTTTKGLPNTLHIA